MPLPVVDPPLTLRTWRRVRAARVVGGRVVMDEAWKTVTLTGQEYLLFRGVRDAEGAGRWAEDWGNPRSYLYAGRMALLGVRMEALTTLHEGLRSESDPDEVVQDWITLAGLLDYLTGLQALTGDPARVVNFAEKVRSVGVVQPTGWPDAIQRINDGEPWIVAILGGLARMGLTSRVEGDTLVVECLSHMERASDSLFGSPVAPRRRCGTFGFDLVPRAVAEQAASIADFVLQEHGYKVGVGPDGTPYLTLSSGTGTLGLIADLLMQWVVALTGSGVLQRCRSEECPGPPERPGVFAAEYGSTHDGATYCHRLCARAATQDR